MIDVAKLFRVLVLGGAALGATHCGPAGPDPAPQNTPDAGPGTTGDGGQPSPGDAGQNTPDGGSPSFW